MRTILITLLSSVLLMAACGEDGITRPETTPPETTPGGGLPDTPASVPDHWPRGEVFVSGTEISVSGEEGDVTAVLGVTGDLPTPCAVAQWEVSDDGHTVAVELWSVEDPAQVCAQVLEPFSVRIGLGTFAEGRTVSLNDEVVGDFSA